MFAIIFLKLPHTCFLLPFHVVLTSHGGASHHPLLETLKELRRHWASDLCDHGAYIKELIEHCGCQSVSKATTNYILGMSIVKYNKTSPIEVIYVESPNSDDALTDV